MSCSHSHSDSRSTSRGPLPELSSALVRLLTPVSEELESERRSLFTNQLVRRAMMASNDEERGVLVSVLAGIGIGVLVGAVAGLLLAPKSGQETRDELSKSLNELSDRVSDLGRNVGSKVSSAVDRTRAQMAQKLG